MSLRGFSPISPKYYADVHGISSICHGLGWDIQKPCLYACVTTLLGDLRGCWNVQRQVCSGRERRNGYSLPQAILTLTDDEWDGEEWLSSFRLLWSAETGQGHFEFYCSMYKKSTGLSFFEDCNSRMLILSLADNNCTK